jgi:hypothetical protein
MAFHNLRYHPFGNRLASRHGIALDKETGF